MKHAFSSLISKIKHLLANVICTFVENWLNCHIRRVYLEFNGGELDRSSGDYRVTMRFVDDQILFDIAKEDVI